VFIATGAHESWRLNLENEHVEGVYPSIDFLKKSKMEGIELARGHVGVIGGGNSAVDAARVALRQKGVTGVSLFYRRSRDEMPAYEEEIEAALEEGVRIETLISPVKIKVRQEEIETAIKEGIELHTLVSPVKIFSEEGRVVGIECIRNRLGEVDATGRRRPVEVPGSGFSLALDTLIIAIGERPESGTFASMGLEVDRSGRIKVDPRTLRTGLEGVFAGGDLVTGPNTVIDAIAAGKKAAQVIDGYLQGREVSEPSRATLPSVFIPPATVDDSEAGVAGRAIPPAVAPDKRTKNFIEVEMALPEDHAQSEARRCLRCDLAFTREASADQ